jgi:hypothetical protein
MGLSMEFSVSLLVLKNGLLCPNILFVNFLRPHFPPLKDLLFMALEHRRVFRVLVPIVLYIYIYIYIIIYPRSAFSESRIRVPKLCEYRILNSVFGHNFLRRE